MVRRGSDRSDKVTGRQKAAMLLLSLGPETAAAIYKNLTVTRLDCIDEQGMVAVPDGPGLGVEYAWAYITQHSTGKRAYGV